jgi:hypothetical protein
MYNSSQAQLEWERDTLETAQFEFPGEWEFSEEIGLESPFSESEEMELAAELLQITDEAELDQFLGKLIKGAWRGIKKIGGKILRPLGGVLKIVAKKALPYLAGAAGTFFGGPAGGAIAAKLGSMVSKALEAELEGLSPEDQEFEMARRFVRLAGAAARQAALTPPGIDPQAAANNAVLAAARQQISGLSNGRPQSGRWHRRGRTIVLVGI